MKIKNMILQIVQLHNLRFPRFSEMKNVRYDLPKNSLQFRIGQLKLSILTPMGFGQKGISPF